MPGRRHQILKNMEFHSKKPDQYFFDEYAIQYFDEDDSSLDEDRFLMLGLSTKFRILIVSHSVVEERGSIRIISAREATKFERKFYTTQTL